jgi:hypothetical protein
VVTFLIYFGVDLQPYLGLRKYYVQAGEEFVREEYADLEDACQSGYIAYGLKRKRGRLVPNCVPKQQFKQLLLEDIIKLELQKL